MRLKKIIKNCLPYGIAKKIEEKRLEWLVPTASVEPFLFDECGNRKRTFYLDDRVCMHSPYSFSSINVGETHYINWDRFNTNLKYHFYSHNQMLEIKTPGEKNFGILIESEAIVPDLYSKLLNSPRLISKFDGIFTHSERLLNKYDNTFFIPGSSVWYGGTAGGGKLYSEMYKFKTKGISLVSSNKSQCNLHNFRLHLAELFQSSDVVDVMGTFNGGNYVSISDSLEKYRFSIVIENNITSCYFTEKILNFFASMTIPIYAGATDIGRFFDSNGIISISPSMTDDEIYNAVSRCTQDFYLSRIDAVKRNYEIVKQFLCIEDYIYEKYKELFI